MNQFEMNKAARVNTELSAHLLSSIDRAIAFHKTEGIKAAKALKLVLKELDINAHEYWDMCQTDIRFKEK